MVTVDQINLMKEILRKIIITSFLIKSNVCQDEQTIALQTKLRNLYTLANHMFYWEGNTLEDQKQFEEQIERVKGMSNPDTDKAHLILELKDRQHFKKIYYSSNTTHVDHLIDLQQERQNLHWYNPFKKISNWCKQKWEKRNIRYTTRLIDESKAGISKCKDELMDTLIDIDGRVSRCVSLYSVWDGSSRFSYVPAKDKPLMKTYYFEQNCPHNSTTPKETVFEENSPSLLKVHGKATIDIRQSRKDTSAAKKIKNKENKIRGIELIRT